MDNRILFVIDNLKVGGAEQVFADIVRLCNGQINFDVLLITNFNGDEIKLPENIKVVKLQRRGKYNIIDLLQVKSILLGYDIVHIHMRHTYLYLAIVKKAFFLKNIFILHDHYGKICIDKSKPFQLARFLKPNLYIGVCDELCIWAIGVWKLKTENVFCFQNLPNLDSLNNLGNRVGGKNGKLIMVGNIKSIKNQLFALRIANSVNMKIDFIGNNQDEDYYNILKSDLKENLIIENCLNANLVLHKYTLGIFTSKSESGPLVILEYLLAGLPFVAYKTGGISIILSKYFPDFFIDSFDEKLWIHKINYFRLNPPVIDREIVLNIIEIEFNRDTYMSRLLNIYEN